MFACIFVPDFPVESLLRTRPELRDAPIAIVAGIPPLAYVIAGNAPARAAGIEPGMTAMQAEDLLRRRPLVGNVPPRAFLRSAATERAAHAALLDAAYAFSPRVEDTTMDTLLLDLDGLERLFGPDAKLARRLAECISELGMEANIAVAANPETAEHAARGFPGITVIPAGREAERLGPLPLEVLFASELHIAASPSAAADAVARIQQTLDRWGIRNFRALAALPAVSFSERLGQQGVRLQRLAAGRGSRELILREPESCFEEAVELESSIELLEPLAFLLGRMLEQLCARLTARALSTNELRLRLRVNPAAHDEETVTVDELAAQQTALSGGRGWVERKLTLPVPMNDARLFLKLFNLELSSHPLGAPVTALRLQAEAARPRLSQAGLFLSLAPEPEKLELTLARIHRVLNPRGNAPPENHMSAGSAELLDSYQPDAFRMVRFRPRLPEENPQSPPDAAAAQHPPQMAMRVFRPPLPATAHLRNGHPVRLLCTALGISETAHDNVAWAAGPWRSSGQWWLEVQSRMDDHARLAASVAQAQSLAANRDRAIAADPDRFAGRQNDEQPTPWDREEWDIALAITHTAITGERTAEAKPPRRMRETHIALFRIFRENRTGEWFVQGNYD